jgi:hypothetical protein
VPLIAPLIIGRGILLRPWGLSRNRLRQKTTSAPLTATRHPRISNHPIPAKHSKINSWVRVYWRQDTSKRTPMTDPDRLARRKREECRECETRSLVFHGRTPPPASPRPQPAGTIADQHDPPPKTAGTIADPHDPPPKTAGTIADQHDPPPEDDSNRICDSPQGRSRTPRPKIRQPSRAFCPDDRLPYAAGL